MVLELPPPVVTTDTVSLIVSTRFSQSHNTIYVYNLHTFYCYSSLFFFCFHDAGVSPS